MHRRMLCLIWVGLALTSCQKEKAEDSTEEAEAPVVSTAEQQPASSAKPAKETVKKEPEITCDSLGIPSYELWIRDLAALRCESCHNDKIAFNGIKFLQYDDFKTYSVQARNRIANNMLTQPLDPIEKGIFLDWFGKGMPNTEKDCQNMK